MVKRINLTGNSEEIKSDASGIPDSNMSLRDPTVSIGVTTSRQPSGSYSQVFKEAQQYREFIKTFKEQGRS